MIIIININLYKKNSIKTLSAQKTVLLKEICHLTKESGDLFGVEILDFVFLVLSFGVH